LDPRMLGASDDDDVLRAGLAQLRQDGDDVI
jgi:hypothetical protein